MPSLVQSISVLLAGLAALSTVTAQLSGAVGPTTSTASKRAKICSVLDYGGSVGSNDIGPAILSAFNNCVTKASTATLYVPPGKYNMQTWVTLNHGSNWAFQMDGVITRTSTTGGHMIIIQNANNFEMFSSNSAGAIQGNGYQCRNAGPRLIRIVTSTRWSIHDLILVDSPEFHLIVQTGSGGEVYNMAIRGGNIGGSDGIDISGTNHWVHDVEVTNRDECVTVKSPSDHFLIERIWCNQSGGSAIGSLSDGTAISDIVYRNVYTNGGNQVFMIKSWGGSGYVRNVLLQNFLSRGTAYGLNVNQYWSSQSQGDGPGVALSNIVFDTWDGIVVDGVQRAPIQFLCAEKVPCTGMTLKNVNMWSSTGKAVWKCGSAFGSGACLKSGSAGTYAAQTSSYAQPPGYTTPPSLSGDLSAGFATNAAIPIPTIPSTYYPGLPQISPLAKNNGGGGGTPTTTTKPTTTANSGGGGGTVAQYGQCGGSGYSGATTCASPYKCTYSSEWYSQCL